MPTYRCDGKNCGFATDSLEEFIRHIREEEKTSAAKPKTRHRTLREYIECPECYVNLEKTLLARGWTKTEEKKEEKKRGLLL